MRRTPFLVLAVTAALGGCSSAPPDTDSTPYPLVTARFAPPVTDVSSLPEGAELRVSLNTALGLDGAKVGERFYAMVVEPVTTTYSEVVVPAGATVTGTILALPDPKTAELKVSFDRISFGGRTRSFAAEAAHPATSWPAGATITLRTTREITF